MVVALELKCIIETNLIRVNYRCISCYFYLTFLLNSCTQATRRRASVIKLGMVDVDVRISSHLKEKLAWAADKRLRVISTKILFIAKCHLRTIGVNFFTMPGM